MTRRSWHMLGRGIKAALLLQREPDISLIEAAHALKFHDGSGLSRHFKRVFGRRPSFLRWRLSWEWLLDDWARDNLGRGALSPVRSSTPAEVATAGRRLAQLQLCERHAGPRSQEYTKPPSAIRLLSVVHTLEPYKEQLPCIVQIRSSDANPAIAICE